MLIIWRVLVSLAGIGGLGFLAVETAIVSQNPPASTAVMIWGILVFAGVAVMSISAIAFGVYKPIRDWLEARAAQH